MNWSAPGPRACAPGLENLDIPDIAQQRLYATKTFYGMIQNTFSIVCTSWNVHTFDFKINKLQKMYFRR